MPFSWTTTDLLESIKTRAMIPTSQATFTTARLLQMADEDLQTVIAPMIMQVKGDYFVTNNDQTITSETHYPIPGDAIGLKIKDCFWIDPGDSEEREVQITQVNLADVTNQYCQGWTFGYYLQNNDVVLVPSGMQDTTLRIKYYRRASKLIPTDEAGQVTAVDTVTNIITLDNVPAEWAVGDDLCGVDADPGFLTVATGMTISSISSPNVTVDDVGDLAVGNWVCLDGDSPIPQISPEAHPILAQSVAVTCLESLNDPNLQAAQITLERLKMAFIQTMTPRADGQAKKIVQRNGTLAWRKIGRYGWWA
jgi:hypothetical protein